MQKTRISIALFMISGVISLSLAGWNLAGALGAEAALSIEEERRVMSSIVQIEMFGRATIEGNQRHTTVASGLGTLVQAGRQRFIITHNHWSVSAAELARAELRDAAGERLLVLDAPTFLSLIRYQDAGTMIFAAPPQLTGVLPAALGDGATLVAGDVVWRASQHAGREYHVGLASARVRRVEAAVVPGLIELQGSNAPVLAGDSGGGIWHDGRLVGNLWAITEATVSPSWREWLGAPAKWQPTGQILAGVQPLGQASRLTISDLAPELANGTDYERGPQRQAP